MNILKFTMNDVSNETGQQQRKGLAKNNELKLNWLLIKFQSETPMRG